MGKKIINPILDLQKNYKKMIFLNSFVFNDSEANAFLNVVRPYDNTRNELAITNFIKAYKLAHGVNRLSDIGDIAIYLMYGGTEIACCLNLINPSLSNTFNLVKVGSPTFDANGITTSGTAYLKTGITTTNVLTTNNITLGVYVRNNLAGASAIIGTSNNVSTKFNLYSRFTDNKAYFGTADSASYISGANNDSRRFTIGTKTSSTYGKLFNNNTVIGSRTVFSGSMPNAEITLNYERVSSGSLYSAYNLSFILIGKGRTDAQCIAITNAVNQLQTDLGRAV